MNTLLALISFVNVSHMLWNEAFQVGIVCKIDGSLWVRWFVDSTLYEVPASESDEVIAMVGKRVASDEGWRLL
jgi:hypothetical protein